MLGCNCVECKSLLMKEICERKCYTCKLSGRIIIDLPKDKELPQEIKVDDCPLYLGLTRGF